MKLKKYTEAQYLRVKTGIAYIAINRKGTIAFSQKALDEFQIHETDKILPIQDEASPKDWYLTKSPEGFTLRSRKGKGYLYFANKVVANELLDSVKHSSQSAIFRLGEVINYQKMELITILTAKAL